MEFAPRQRWYSSSEPELGIGTVLAVEGRDLRVVFGARGITRLYVTDGAPLVRARLSVGSMARGRDGTRFTVEEVEERGPLLRYRGEGAVLDEVDLADTLDLSSARDRLKAGQLEHDARLFDLRCRARRLEHRLQSSPWRGFLGGRIALYPHQLYVAAALSERHRARALLCDEVGLGKTIEAALLIHRFVLTGRAARVLVLVPPGLVHQWFAELFLRFHLPFQVAGRAYLDDAELDDELPGLETGAQRVICPFDRAVEEDWSEGFDLVVVDEAHGIEPDTPLFATVRELAAESPHLLLLTATPVQAGERGHFERLKLLDPARFTDYESFQRDQERVVELASHVAALEAGKAPEAAALAPLRAFLGAAAEELEPWLEQAPHSAEAREELLAALVDGYGLGRLMFRNVRERVGGFPLRKVHAVELKGDVEAWSEEFRALHDAYQGRAEKPSFGRAGKDPRVRWLVELLDGTADKVLLLCASAARTVWLEKFFRRRGDTVATFHEGMSLLERDRQAAWFQDPDGPALMISAPLGAEGRNFQCAKHLVLFDLPFDPEQVEQRIGRLDRIGQGAEIAIHLPYVPGTPQERLLRLFRDGLGLFTAPWHGSLQFHHDFAGELYTQCTRSKDSTFDKFLRRVKKADKATRKELEAGRDRLLERSSFAPEEARRIRDGIAGLDEDPLLERLVLGLLEASGIAAEELGARSYLLTPGPDYHSALPGFHDQGMRVCFDRAAALEAEGTFLSGDHPMLRAALEALLAQGKGNACVAVGSGPRPGLRVDGLFVLESTARAETRAERFLPPTPIVLRSEVDGAIVEPGPAAPRRAVPPPTAAIAALQNERLLAKVEDTLEALRAAAEERVPGLVQAARERMEAQLEPHLARLERLARRNPTVSAEELEVAREERARLRRELGETQLRLDGLRVELVMPG